MQMLLKLEFLKLRQKNATFKYVSPYLLSLGDLYDGHTYPGLAKCKQFYFLAQNFAKRFNHDFSISSSWRWL